MAGYSWAEIGGVRLEGAPAEPGKFRGMMLSRLIGWRGLSGARGDAEPIPNAHGSFAQTSILREPRSMELRGAAVSASAGETSAMLELLEAATAGGPVELRVGDADGVWSRMVEVEFMTPADAWNRPVVTFAMDLFAPDPIRYRDMLTGGPVGLPTRSGGLVLPSAFPWSFGVESREVATIQNDGAVPVLPRMTVSGSGSAVTVRGGARRIEFGPFAGVLVFDSLERRAWLNGVDVTRELVRRDWPSVAPGEVADFYFQAVGPSPDLSLSVEYRIGVW